MNYSLELFWRRMSRNLSYAAVWQSKLPYTPKDDEPCQQHPVSRNLVHYDYPRQGY